MALPVVKSAVPNGWSPSSYQIELERLADSVGDFVIAGDADGKPRADLKRPWDLIVAYARRGGVRIHDVRHTQASIGAGGGLGLPIIGKLLGQCYAETAARYPHLDADPFRKVSNRIADTIAAAMQGDAPAAQILAFTERKMA